MMCVDDVMVGEQMTRVRRVERHPSPAQSRETGGEVNELEQVPTARRNEQAPAPVRPRPPRPWIPTLLSHFLMTTLASVNAPT